MADVKTRFNAAFMHLATVTRLPTVEVTPDTKRAYWDALNDLPIEALESAASRLGKEAAWMPKAAEWRAAATQAKKVVELRALTAGDREQRDWRHECNFCEDSGWCYEGGQTLHDVVVGGYAGRPRMHACVCRATNRTYQRRWRSQFGERAS